MSDRHIRTNAFNKCYKKLPSQIQESADEKFEEIKEDPNASTDFEKLSGWNNCWRVRFGEYRALATKYENIYIWFWIGTKGRFNALIGRGNPVPTNIPFERIEQQQRSLTTSLVSGWQKSSQPSVEDVNTGKLDNLIQEAISDFNEDRYEEWR